VRAGQKEISFDDLPHPGLLAKEKVERSAPDLKNLGRNRQATTGKPEILTIVGGEMAKPC
jgi:hypothetical protein